MVQNVRTAPRRNDLFIKNNNNIHTKYNNRNDK